MSKRRLVKTVPLLIATLLLLSSSFYTIPRVRGQTVVAAVQVGTSPEAIDVNNSTNEIYVENYRSNTTSVINGATNTVVATIPVGQFPFGPGRFVNHITNRIYVSNNYGRNVTVINGATKTVLTTIPIPVRFSCSPVGIAVNEATNRIYVACTFGAGAGGCVLIVDGANNTVIGSTTSSFGACYSNTTFSPTYVAVNPVTNRIYVTDGRSNHQFVNVIDGATNAQIATVCCGGGGPLDVNPTTNRVYSSSADFFSRGVVVIDGSTNTVITTIVGRFSPFGVAVNEATNKIFVAVDVGVEIIDGGTNTVELVSLSALPTTCCSSGVAVNSATDLVYVTEPSANRLVVMTTLVGFTGVMTDTNGVLNWNGLSNMTWHAWRDLAGSSPSAPAQCKSGIGSFELVVRGYDNQIYHKSFSNGAWSGAWDTITSGLTDTAPACSVATSTLYVAVRGMDGSVYVTSKSLPTGPWAAWTNLGGFTPSSPTIVATSNPSRVDVIVRGADNGVYHKASIGGGAWSAWDKEPNGIVLDTPVALGDGDGVAIIVMGATETGTATPFPTIWYNKYSFTTGWIGWTLLGHSPSNPSATKDAFGAIHVVIRDSDNTVKHKARPSGGTFPATWDNLGGVVSGTPIVGVTGDLLVVLARDSNNIINSNISQTGGTSWLGWTSTGGSSTSDPSLPYQ